MTHLPRRILITGACLAAIGPASALAATNDRPSAGRFSGTHAFDGAIKLTFDRESGIGLYVKRYAITGTLRCDDESIPIDLGGMVTARTAARVKSNRRFIVRTATAIIEGRFVSSRRVEGDLTLRTSPCTKTGGFRARRR